MKILKNSIKSTVAIFAASILIVSCTPENKESESLKELDNYVSKIDNETADNWEEVENNYQEKKAAAEMEMDDFSEEQKAKFNELQANFEEKKIKYAEMAEKKAEETAQQSAINKMYLTVKNPNRDLNLEAVTAENIKKTYSNFVAYVKSNQEAMSIEAWKEAELIWDALNERKNVVEPDLAAADNREIAKLKIEYGTLKTTNKPGAKMQSKEDTEEKREMKN